MDAKRRSRPVSWTTDDASAPSSDLIEVWALLRLAERLLATTDARATAAALLDAIVALYGFPRALLVTSLDGHLSLLAGHGLPREQPALTGDSRALERSLDEARSRVVRAVDAGEETWLATMVPEGSDLLVVPMLSGERRQGALVLQLPELRQPGWREAITEPLERAVAATAQALTTRWQVERLERLASTDGLTEIPNRGSFTSALEQEVARSTRTGHPLSLVMFDLDEFKAVNDQFGHQAGDDALRNVAAALARACRDLDTAARYGGEEFVVILPDCGPERALVVAERLRAAVASASAARPLTASAGVASFPEHAGDGHALVRAADDALMVSKRSGRNRTTGATSVRPAGV